MIPLPNLGLGFTGGTTRPENHGDVGGGLNTGGLTFGGKSTLDLKTIALIGAGALVIFIVLKRMN